ncbi:hypothetical protein ACJRO7_019824 [Eucalyptus globulus]|uniref:5'-3' DNA helicase ZGRF1-like N-terminal domain-containing protein n=1 Tax=Eucalyptus globulus TaxID=34317 RepID=A0ABD3KMP8_EUCGL
MEQSPSRSTSSRKRKVYRDGFLSLHSSTAKVLYTTQVTRKAEKYHDGLLQLEVRGSLGRQVTLYDASVMDWTCDTSRKGLVNKFPRKDEVLGTEKLLVFDSRLVDMGEHGVKERVLIGLNDHEPHLAAGEMKTGHGQVDGAKVDQSINQSKEPSYEQADPKFCSSNLVSEASLSRSFHGNANDESITPEGDRDPLKVKAECPSFDLGF